MKFYECKAKFRFSVSLVSLAFLGLGAGVLFTACGPEIVPITVSISENAMRIIDPPQSSITWSDPALPSSWDFQRLCDVTSDGWYFRTDGNETLTYQVTKVVNVDDFNQ